MENVKKLFDDYILNTYRRVGQVFVKGKGNWLWDENGKKYLDLFPGWGVSILGHSHPAIIKAIEKQAKELIHLPNNLYHKNQALLAKKIVDNSFPAKVFFANSGAEAVEGAIKISRLFGRSSGRYEIVTMKNSFHGRTFGAMSATGQVKYKNPFKPILPSFIEAEFNNFNDLKAKINKNTVGILMELIQGEGGVNIATKKFVKAVNDLCKEYKLLFIVDEVQTGMARCGKLFAFEYYGIIPDIMVLSKGLGAGVPISALVVNNQHANLMSPGMHASTFGGSPFVTAVSLETFNIIKKEKLLNNAATMGKYLISRLSKLKKKFLIIKEVRGLGLMVGIELNCESFPIFEEALRQGLIVNSTHINVLRIMPALNVNKAEIDKGLKILEEVLANFNRSV